MSKPEVKAAIVTLSGAIGASVGASSGSSTGPGAIATAKVGQDSGLSMGLVINTMVKILPALLAMISDKDRGNQETIPTGFENQGGDQGQPDTGISPILIGGAVIAGLALVYFATKKKK